MFCILSFVFLGILGIFSATHREMAKEAFQCVMRRVTLRPCDTGFSEKMRGRILGKLINRSVFLARLFNKHFELLSWIFFILMVASTVWFARGVWNFYRFGNCNGLEVAGFCPFDPTGANSKISTPDNGTCAAGPHEESSLSLGDLDLTQFPRRSAIDPKNRIVFIGCYSCEFTRKTFPIIRKIVANDKTIDFTFIHFPVKGNTEYLSKYDYCVNQVDRTKFWKFNDGLFAAPVEKMSDQSFVNDLLAQNGLSPDAMKACLESNLTDLAVSEQQKQIAGIGIYGTPTVFVNGQALVGPKPERVYKNLLK